MQDINKRFWVENFNCFSIFGSDSKKFLNSITTANIINPKNNVCKTCWLSPNGVLRALIEILYFDNKVDVVILEGDLDEIRDYFNKIIFPADDVSLGGSFSINRFQEIDEINSWKFHQPFFINNDDQEYEIYKNKLNIVTKSGIKFWKINQAIPSLDNEIDGKNNPLELGLTDLIDFKKGCYLGQETMSKIKNVSSLKQEIRVWNSSNNILNLESKNKNIYTSQIKENVIGKITSFHKVDSNIIGLAMIKRKYLEVTEYCYSEIFGQIKFKKSIGSNFL